MRPDGRNADQLREVKITRRYTDQAPGSVLYQSGKTVVLCTACVDPKVPDFLEGKGQGWVTAEYGMLPGSTHTRKPRERNKVDGRTYEIQRLLGRALRAVVDRELLGERTLWVDCDVLQADGGTRTAAITGAYVALAQAESAGRKRGLWKGTFLREPVAAISAGIVDGRILLDLAYEEDSRADVDFNVVMTASGKFVEVQGTAEAAPFERKDLNRILDLAAKGIDKLIALQKMAVRRRVVRAK